MIAATRSRIELERLLDASETLQAGGKNTGKKKNTKAPKKATGSKKPSKQLFNKAKPTKKTTKMPVRTSAEVLAQIKTLYMDLYNDPKQAKKLDRPLPDRMELLNTWTRYSAYELEQLLVDIMEKYGPPQGLSKAKARERVADLREAYRDVCKT